MENEQAAAQPGALDERRGPRAGRDDRVRAGHQQAGGARGDPPVAAEIDRAVLPGGGAGRPRRAALGLRPAVAAEGCRAARVLHRQAAGPRREAARLAAVSRRPRASPRATAAATCTSARISARRRNGSAARCATSAATSRSGSPRRRSKGSAVEEEARSRSGGAGRSRRRGRSRRAASRCAVRSRARPMDDVGGHRRRPAGVLQGMAQPARAAVVGAGVYRAERCGAGRSLPQAADESCANCWRVTGIGERKAELYGSEIFAAFEAFRKGARAAARAAAQASPADETMRLLAEGKTLRRDRRRSAAGRSRRWSTWWPTWWRRAGSSTASSGSGRTAHRRIEEAIGRLGSQWLKPLREALPRRSRTSRSGWWWHSCGGRAVAIRRQ